MISLKEFAEKLKKEKKVALICHVRPDGDCIGSSLALANALNSIGVSAKVCCSDDIPEKFNFIGALDKIAKQPDDDCTALVAVDCADLTRTGYISEKFTEIKNTFNIDHHVSNDNYAKYNAVIDSAANCENVYELIKFLGAEIDVETANLLAMGILTDTGNFKHKNVTAKTLMTASELVKLGADLNKIQYNMFTKQSKQRAKLFGKVMAKIRYFLDDRFAVASIHKTDLIECGAKSDETEGFIDFIMGIDGVEVGACILENDNNKYKVSLRSKDTDVCAVASAFGGGGHILASGCQIFGEYEEVVDRVVFEVKKQIRD